MLSSTAREKKVSRGKSGDQDKLVGGTRNYARTSGTLIIWSLGRVAAALPVFSSPFFARHQSNSPVRSLAALRATFQHSVHFPRGVFSARGYERVTRAAECERKRASCVAHASNCQFSRSAETRVYGVSQLFGDVYSPSAFEATLYRREERFYGWE